MAAVSRGPEIIAVHVPKTAGSAFRVVLESVYEKENVEHDRSRTTATRPLRRDSPVGERSMEAEVELRTSWPKVITGHFPLWKYERFRRSAFTIVWLREPAARLLSQYFNARARLSALRPGAPGAAWARTFPPEQIMEIEWPSNLVTDWFLRGYDLDDLDFVGIWEHFAEDVADLGRMLGWPEIEIPVRARTATPEYLDFRPSPPLLRKIRAANHADVELYERALERRRVRRGSAGAAVADGKVSHP